MKDLSITFFSCVLPVVMCMTFIFYTAVKDSQHIKEIKLLEIQIEKNNQNFICALESIKKSIDSLTAIILKDND